MPLSAPLNRITNRPVRERALILGPPKTGKSSLYLQIAKWSQETGSDAQFHVLDTDSTLEKLLGSPDSQYSHLTNIIPYLLYDYTDNYRFMWEKIYECAKQVKAAVRPHDWVCYDMASAFWHEVQVWYKGRSSNLSADEIAGADLERKWKGEKKSIEGFEWVDVRKHYYEAIKPVLFSTYAHVIMVTEADKLYEDIEPDPNRKLDFHKVGHVPAGEKHLPYQVDTILYMEKRKRGRFITTIGDRERQWVDNLEINDYVMDYLRPIAKWEVA